MVKSNKERQAKFREKRKCGETYEAFKEQERLRQTKLKQGMGGVAHEPSRGATVLTNHETN